MQIEHIATEYMSTYFVIRVFSKSCNSYECI